jgi:hypothetical protein
VPFQGAQLAGAGAGRRRQDGEGAQPRPPFLLGRGEQDADLLGGERRWCVGGDGRWLGVGGGVGRQAVPFHGVAEGLVQAQVQLADGAGTKPALLAVLAAVLGQLVVQALQGGKRAQGESAEVGAQVVLLQLAVAADGSQPDTLVCLEVGEPVVQQVVERRGCRPTNDSAFSLEQPLWRLSAWSSADRAGALVG